jgi:hypothetical protein
MVISFQVMLGILQILLYKPLENYSILRSNAPSFHINGDLNMNSISETHYYVKRWNITPRVHE